MPPRPALLSSLFHPACPAFPPQPASLLRHALPHSSFRPLHRPISSFIPPKATIHSSIPIPKPPCTHRHVLFALAVGGASIVGAALYTNLDADERISRRKEMMGMWFREGGAARGLDLGMARERMREVRERAMVMVKRFPHS